MFRADYHIHSGFSGDSNENIEDIVRQAISLELDEIAITDHLEYDMLDIDFEKWTLDLDKYKEKIMNLKEIYEEKITIRYGVEIGVQPQTREYLESLVGKYDFDFVIASNHGINKIDLSNGTIQKGKTRDEVQKLYFQTILKNIDLYTKYNVWGHLDFITRYGGKEFLGMDLSKNWNLITEILEKLIEKGKGIEINTSGYRYNENRVYPCFEIIKKYVELGGKIITIGSDAHTKEQIAMDFSKAYEILKELKVEYITTFEKMKPIFKKI